MNVEFFSSELSADRKERTSGRPALNHVVLFENTNKVLMNNRANISSDFPLNSVVYSAFLSLLAEIMLK